MTSREQASYRILVLGSNCVGKTSIITQLLYDRVTVDHTQTLQEMYRGEFNLRGSKIILDIEDTGGSFATEFPAMLELSLSKCHGILLVFSVSDQMTFRALDSIS